MWPRLGFGGVAFAVSRFSSNCGGPGVHWVCSRWMCGAPIPKSESRFVVSVGFGLVRVTRLGGNWVQGCVQGLGEFGLHLRRVKGAPALGLGWGCICVGFGLHPRWVR